MSLYTTRLPHQVRVGVANAPESGKRGMVRSRSERARRTLAAMRRAGCDVILLQESGTFMRRVVRRTPNLRGVWTRNVIRRRGLWFRGNGIVWDHSEYRRVGKVERYKVAAGVKIVRVRLLHRETGATFTATATHAPTRRGRGHGPIRQRLNRLIRRRARTYQPRLSRDVIGLDANDGRWIKEVRRFYNAAARDGVMWLAASKDLRVSDPEVIPMRPRGGRPGLSDHDAIAATLTIPKP